MMAGIHFIILKVNGIDVSQMPHEEAVQMFLKASEPILVEVRRRSYISNGVPVFESEESQNSKRNINSKRQSPTIKQLTSPTHKNPQIACESPTTIDLLTLNSLVISSSQNTIGLDSITRNKNEYQSNNGGLLPVISPKNNNNSASTSSHYSSNNQIYNADDPCHQTITQCRSGSASSATSPTKSLQIQSATSSPFKEVRTTPAEGVSRLISNKGLVSVGIQTDKFTTDFIFSSSSLLNPQQIIENDQNLFGECMAPEIDIEEITLRKSDSNERLGLTVCYSSGGGNGSGSDDTDTCTEVYISDIVPDSIAGRDGRLRQGDQILQVNGKDVSNKEETETLIAENNNAVTLLVSRYLFGDDDDDFNDQEDYYDDEVPEMAYANCILSNYILDEDLPKSTEDNCDISSENKHASEKLSQADEAIKANSAAVCSTQSLQTGTKPTLSTSSVDPLNHQNIRAHLEQVNQEIAILDSRVETMMSQHAKPVKPVEASSVPKETITPNVMKVMDYDTEHIYETIPEDSESEPFYCSPYESSEHQIRIEQWLGMQEGNDANESKFRSLQQKHHNTQAHHESLGFWVKTKNGTVHSTNSSAGDDHENSSSAYNTGGSCNSNTMTPLTLELNTHYRDREQHSTSTLVLCSTKQITNSLNETIAQHRLPMQTGVNEITENAKSLHRISKDKLISPTHSSKVSQNISNKQKVVTIPQKISKCENITNVSDSIRSNSQTTPISASNTMYTNEANLQQTMLLQQELFRQALIHQRVPSNSIKCPQFTAPNLSQYHFVSSQEVSTVKINTHTDEEHMVWKVKRRQDGTRYIVRRPARNRFLRNRALRISAERNEQTTEDDTISEIKTGRYWTKDERKKHIERARERRQRQQIIITSKNNEILPLNYSCEILQKNLNEKLLQTNPDSSSQQQTSQPKFLQAINTLNAATSAKLCRQNIPTGQFFSKKLMKKLANSPVELGPAVSVNSNVVSTGTSKSTTTSSGNKMLQGALSDNSYLNRVIHPPL